MSKNYYQEKFKQIENLIIKGKHSKALKEIMDELNVPYIPFDVKERLYKLKKNTLYFLRGDVEEKETFSRHKLIDFLFSEKIENQKIALLNLQSNNLHLEKDILKKRMDLWVEEKEQLLKTSLYEIIYSQNIDMDIEFGDKKINTLKYGSVFDGKAVEDTHKEIERITQNNISFRTITHDNFKLYLLLIFPKRIDEPIKLAHMLFNITKHLFDFEKKLTTEEKDILYKIMEGQYVEQKF